MLEGLAVWALFIYLLRLVGMPWNTATKSFAYLGGVSWLMFVWVGLINYTPMDLSGGSVVQSPHIQLRPDSPNVTGKVDNIYIEPNQKVKKGQLIYEIDPTQYQIAYNQAKVEEESAMVELEVAFSAGLKHIARWDGVQRKPSLQGPGNGVSTDFDWNMQAAVASIQISVYDMELQRVFVSRGGMDATEAIDTRSSSGRYVRRRNILENEDNVKEGIALALHPLIEMEDWPGNP